MVARNRLAEGVGLIAGVAALAMGGVAMGLELERRIVSKRIDRCTESELEEFFSLRSDGPQVTTADGVVLHTEIDDGPAEDFTLLFVHGYALNLDCWHFQRKHFVARFARSSTTCARTAAPLARRPTGVGWISWRWTWRRSWTRWSAAEGSS